MQVVKTKSHYIIDGKPYLRVTHLLDVMWKDPEYREAPRDPKAYREATKVGTQVDKLIQQDLKGLKLTWPTKVTPDLKGAWEAYQEFKRIYKPLSTAEGGIVQRLVYCPLCGLAGSTDYEEPTPTPVTDFKATAKLLIRNWLQTNTYLRIGYPSSYEQLSKRLVRLDKMTGMQQTEVKPYSEREWAIVMNLKRAYDLVYLEALDGAVAAAA